MCFSCAQLEPWFYLQGWCAGTTSRTTCSSLIGREAGSRPAPGVRGENYLLVQGVSGKVRPKSGGGGNYVLFA